MKRIISSVLVVMVLVAFAPLSEGKVVNFCTTHEFKVGTPDYKACVLGDSYRKKGADFNACKASCSKGLNELSGLEHEICIRACTWAPPPI